MSAVHLEKMLRSLGAADEAALPCLTLHEWSLRHFQQGSPPLAPEHHRLYAMRSCPLATTSKDYGRASEEGATTMQFSGDAAARRRRSSDAESPVMENSPAQRRGHSGPLKMLRRWTSVVYRRGGRGGSMRAKRTKSTTSTASVSQ